MIKVTVGKKGITTGSVSVSVRDFGAVADGNPNDFQNFGTDNSAAFQAAIDSLPATGGEIRIPGKGVYTLESEVFVNKPNVHITMDPAAIITIWNITGTGTPDVHNTVNVLTAFKVTADNCTFTGGRITGRGGSDGKNICAILVAGVDHFTASYMKIDRLYTSIWCGGGAENIKLAYLELDLMSHNLLMGYSDSQVSTTAPQVNKAVILGIDSKNSINDGIKLTAFADQIQIIGGHFHDNGKDGIDTFVSGEFISIVGAHCTDNNVKGIDVKWGTTELTPVFGINRNLMIHNCVLKNNAFMGIEVGSSPEIFPDEALDGVSIIGNIAEGNTQQGFQIGAVRWCSVIGNIARNNGSRGFQFRSAHDLAVIGNISDRNCQLGQTEGFVFQKGDGPSPPKTFRIAIIGNQSIGSGVASNQQIGFDVIEVNQGDLRYIGNNAVNNNIANYNSNDPFTSDMRFRDNRGHTTENSGLSAAISTGGTIAHGLQFAPATVSVTPSITASNFINLGRITEAVTESENYNRITEAVTLTENYGSITDGSGATDVSVASNGTNLTVTFGGGGSHAFYWSARTSTSK